VVADSQGMVGYVVYWPPGVDFEVTLEAFIDAFRTKNFAPCDEMNTELEPGYEKVVIYADPDTNEPTHAALQLPSGSWTSKLVIGKTLSIIHDELGVPGVRESCESLKRRINQQAVSTTGKGP